MKYGKGIVKKYSREYSRTLKNGEKKKYKTEQIQITISKSEDIYENKEEVLVIPNSEIETFKKLIDDNVEKIETPSEVKESEYDTLKESYDTLVRKNDKLKQENLNTKTAYAELYEVNENLEKDYQKLIEEYNELVDEYNKVEEDLYNLKAHKSRDEILANRVKEFMMKRVY